MDTGCYKFKHFNHKILYSIIACMFILAPSLANAQMFSVKNEKHLTYKLPGIHIYAGVGPTQFKYRPENSKGVYSFSGEVLNLVLEVHNLKLFFGKGIGLGDVSFYEIGLQGGYELRVYRSRKFVLRVPVKMRIDLTTVTNDHQVLATSVPPFREGSIGIRTGIDFMVLFSHYFRLEGSIIPNFGVAYSASSYDGGGTVLGATGNLRLYFDHLFGKAGLSVGYSYDFRRFSVKGNIFDYNQMENSFLIGITF